ncbi:MAG: ParB/RepB/Spo0J family partition protein [Rhodoferax sp.]|nr:ParB/RepB/Spo0J family partition protein [Rhodoferax sp.]
MTPETFARLQLAHIAPSLTNPRKTFDATKLAELAASIKASGVHQPVLVRPLPGSRVADTSTDPATGKRLAVLPTHELVAGERRYRASKLAGVDTIPAMVRELTDAQVLDIQITENLQRDDLTELEEAEGYQALMQLTGLNAEQVGTKIGKSRAYVYTRLKLLDLCTDVRQALRDKKLEATTATLLARIPNEKLQIEALREVLRGGYDSEPMSFRKAQTYIQEHYMLALDKATFDINCADLLPAAGACTTCPKRTGAEPELFTDVKSADVCTDPVCHRKKEDAHTAAQAALAKAKGLTVIAGKEAAELKAQGYYSDKIVGYRRLDAAEDGFGGTTLRKLIWPLMKAQDIKPVMIESARKKGTFLECLTNETALKLLKQAEKAAADATPASSAKPAKVSKEVEAMVSEKKAKAAARAKAQFEREWRANLVRDAWATMRDDADIKPFSTEVHRFLAIRAALNLSSEDAERVCEILGLGKVSPVRAVADFAKETATPDMLHLLCIMQASSGPHEHDYNGNVPNEGLMLIARNVFTDLAQVIVEIKREVKAKIWPSPAKKASVPTASLAQPQHAAGGKPKGAQAPVKAPAARAKLSAKEALSGIAAAMQGVDRAASAPGGAVAPPEVATKVAAVSYRGPNGETWSGRGLVPKWLRVLVDAGQDKEAFAIKPASTGAALDQGDLFQRAAALIGREGKANVRMLKTELKVGTTKALELMDQLEQAGKVSACDERGARKVLEGAAA